MADKLHAYSLLLLIFLIVKGLDGAAPTDSRSFVFTPKINMQPQLVLIAGCTGTGKSTFGMSLALSQGILKCMSTDSAREVMRTYDQSPALHRSSYEGIGDPVEDWRESCMVLDVSIEALVNDAMKRGVSLVLEGVHIIPSNILIDRWIASGGVALGCLLTITDAEAHRKLIFRRGEVTKKGEEKKINAFSRIRSIQDEMIKMATLNKWLLIEQRLEPDPIDIVNGLLTDLRC